MPVMRTPNQNLRLYSETSRSEEKIDCYIDFHHMALRKKNRAHKSFISENNDAFILYMTSPGGPPSGWAYKWGTPPFLSGLERSNSTLYLL